VQFNVLETMKHPIEYHSLFCIDLLSNVVNNYAFGLLDVLSRFSSSLNFSFSNISDLILDERENCKTGDIEDAVSLYDTSLFCIDLLSNVVNNYAFGLLDVLSGFSSSLDFSFSNISDLILDERKNCKTGDIEDAMSLYDTFVASEFDAEVAGITLGSKMLPFVEQPPTLELKPLPSHLKYVYLERDGKLLVIISALLTDEQEQKLLQVIKDHKRAIGWTLADIPSISPSFCMHRILLEEDVKPVRQP